ncbi:MAG TPA: hypothetical protein VF631_09955 [Allosphingosinicella sp.]|jgi:transcriptional regulator with XRE-family HTH domain|uniref:hypothetical protein n=1 Tax=Allosphingosinicella sp. TaxID=2823234 RepID=UPI002F288A93
MAQGERSEKALVTDGILWVRERREQLGWSQAKLAIRSTKMRAYLGEICPAPTEADVSAFEAGELRQLPRWLKLAAYAFEFVTVPREERAAWLDRRNWYHAGHPIDLCRPLLFRDEYRFMEALNSMSEPDRRAWRAAMTRWYSRNSQGDRAQAARDWLRRLGVHAEVMIQEEREVVEAYRRLRRGKREALRTALREETTWPGAIAPQVTEDERLLLSDFGNLEEDQRTLVRLLTGTPGLLDPIIALLTRMTPEEVDALREEARFGA